MPSHWCRQKELGRDRSRIDRELKKVKAAHFQGMRMDKQSIYHKKWYAEEYDKDRFGGAFGRYLHDHEVETFLSMSMIDENSGRVLDIGAGTGKLSIALMCHSKQVISVDMSAEMLRIAGRKAEKGGMSLKPAINDAHHLSFRDNAFECVISSRMLMHLNDWRRGLSELCRVTEGIVVIDFPPLLSFSGLDSLLKWCSSLVAVNIRGYRVFLVRSIIRELERHDFQVVVLKKDFCLPIAFHRWLNNPRFSMLFEKLCRIFGFARILGAPVTIKAIKNGYRESRRGDE